jgi:hypothetical protein
LPDKADVALPNALREFILCAWDSPVRDMTTAHMRLMLSRFVAVVAMAGCCDDGVHTVNISLRPDIITLPSYVWVGDTVTVSAVAGTASEMFCYRVLYTAVNQPTRFTYSSTDTSVTTLSERGLLRARTIGLSSLRAHSAGVTSYELPVVVAPAVKAFRLTAVPNAAQVGDTISITIDALDDLGKQVVGAQIQTWINRSTDSLATFVSLPRPERPLTTIPTPLTVRLRTLRSGRVTLIVTAPRELPAPRRDLTDSVVVQIEGR